MPDLDLEASTASFNALRPVADENAWPPVSRPLEDDPQVVERLIALGGELDRLPAEARPILLQALHEPSVRGALRGVLVQLGAARLFQLIHWIADHDTLDASRLIASLMAGDDDDAVALRATVNAVTRRAALDRIFSPDRTAAVEAASAVALKEGSMMTRFATLAALGNLIAHPALAQSTGSVGCAAVVQAAANGVTARVGADDQTINQPQSVTQLTCLDNFFNGVGLNLVTNLLNPGNLLQAVEGQICSAVKQEWNNLLGGAQCGLTITGFNFGFGGLGGGLSCPKLSFGGGGPPVGTIGLGTGGSGSGLYINGTGMVPPGYTLPATGTGTF